MVLNQTGLRPHKSILNNSKSIIMKTYSVTFATGEDAVKHINQKAESIEALLGQFKKDNWDVSEITKIEVEEYKVNQD